MTQFSLSWGSYKQSICSGLCALQQNGEFVDMTLAADGHHVKVHQMVMSLVSPYIKELIASASCPHPVIFLNKVSYPTLCAVLEYIYTGEVLIAKDNLLEVVEAAKELKIMGLQDMKVELSTQEDAISQTIQAENNKGRPLGERCGYAPVKHAMEANTTVTASLPSPKDDEDDDMNTDVTVDHIKDELLNRSLNSDTTETSKKFDTRMQYTTSNQGKIQMILNRYMYCLRYTSTRGGTAGHRQWRCVSYGKKPASRCPATVVTKGDVVVKRYGAHNHPFHDARILKRVRENAVFEAIGDAETVGERVKRQRQADSEPADTNEQDGTD